jgi:N-acetylglucosamine-6-sulfatase
MTMRAAMAGLATVAALLAMAPLASAQQTQPNVVVVMTDDQRVWDMEAMPQTNRLLADEGTTFENAVATYPLCCPSRSTFLTGQYAHNHGVLGNAAPEGGYSKFDFANALGVWLQQAGYRTAHVGKQLNEYGAILDPGQAAEEPVPPGYDDWFALRDPSTYSMYNYTVQDNAARRAFGVLPEDYQTDVLANRAIEDIRQWAPEDEPFFVQLATSAVHWEFIDSENGPRPAPRHEGAYADHELHPRPNYAEEDISDKPSVVHHYDGIIDETKTETIAEYHRTRLEALQAVDEAVARIVEELERAGELDRTLIVFTSDNGYLHGEHGMPSEKVVPYEESIRVPLIVRGPGFPAGETRSQLVGNIDLAPTIAAATGAVPGRVFDGESLVPYAQDPRYRRARSLALEADFPEVKGQHFAVVPDYHRYVNVYYDAIRTKRFKYVHWFRDVRGNPVDEYELYDLKADPYEMDSLHESPLHSKIEAKLARELRTFKDCVGAGCRRRIRVRPPCLEHAAAVELGAERRDLLLAAGSPQRAGRREWRYCLEGGGAVRALFSPAGVVRRVITGDRSRRLKGL